MEKQKSKWIALAVVLLAPLLSVIDVFIVNVAIPAVKAGVRATDAQVQLVIAGYLLGYASFLITGGRAGDLFGRKKVFMWGMALFTLTSCLCGLAQSPLQLNLARFSQGISAAFMVPQTISYIQVLFAQPTERTKAVGLFGLTLGIASITGQFLGGYFSESHFAIAGWRLIFFINLPIGLLALLAATIYLPETASNRTQSFDYAGTGILTIALVCLIYPLIQGREMGWPWWTICQLIASGGIFYYFIQHQRSKLKKDQAPLINMDLFQFRDFNIALFTTLFFFMVHTSHLLISTLYFQNGMGIPPYQAGLNFVLWGLGFMISSLLSIRLVVRCGKVVLQMGVFLMLIMLFLQLNLFTLNLPRWTLLLLLIPYGFGSGFVLPSLLNMALKSIPIQFAGAASGVYSTVQQTASALGVSLIGGLFFTTLQSNHGGGHGYLYAFQTGIVADIVCLLLVSYLLYRLPDATRQSKAVILPAE
ncbi:MFS transporter [Spirosoma aureum]|uniref:MFS transporter n=1 Tax=Spirosoma aureum TaxID=2692134 RepID=A0A6G9AQA3_9BACT|nr:MFS transporter [Spirosoma aureum]QIP14393.1 MFS transporter [Spirosoma aureum]